VSDFGLTHLDSQMDRMHFVRGLQAPRILYNNKKQKMEEDYEA